MADTPRLVSSEGELDVRVLARRVARKQWILWLTAALAVLAMTLFIRNATYRYAVSYQVTPAQGDTHSLSAALGDAGGLAQLAGISLPQGGDTSYKLYLQGITSRDVADTLAHDQPLMHEVFKSEWDPAAKLWHEPNGSIRELSIAVKQFLNVPGPRWHRPDGARLQEVLQNQIEVLQTAKSPTATVSMTSDNPRFAVNLLGKLHDTTDEMLRRRALARTTAYVAYLNEKLHTVELTEHRLALTQALGEEERALMVASSPRSFAAEVFQQPAASLTPASPRPVLFIVAAFFGGLVLGLIIISIRIVLEELRREQVENSWPENLADA